MITDITQSSQFHTIDYIHKKCVISYKNFNTWLTEILLSVIQLEFGIIVESQMLYRHYGLQV